MCRLCSVVGWDEPRVAVSAEVDLPAAVMDGGVVQSAEQHPVVDAGGVTAAASTASRGCSSTIRRGQSSRSNSRRSASSPGGGVGMRSSMSASMNVLGWVASMLDTDFHRRCPKGHDQSIRSDQSRGTIEPIGDRSRGLQLTVSYWELRRIRTCVRYYAEAGPRARVTSEAESSSMRETNAQRTSPQQQCPTPKPVRMSDSPSWRQAICG